MSSQQVFSVGAAAADATDAVVPGKGISAPTTLRFEPVGQYFRVVARRRRLKLSICEDNYETQGDAADQDVAEEYDPSEELWVEGMNLDTSEWKHCDLYALLGLKSKRLAATSEDIVDKFKLMTMRHHPDKKSTAAMTDEERSQCDAYFTCVKMAYEQLVSPDKRRLYDSVDVEEGLDAIPKAITAEDPDGELFFSTFGKAMVYNAKWLKKPPPSVGDMASTEDEVDAYYQHWYNTESWREFGYWDKENPENAEGREERRYIERQNKSERKRLQKAEGARKLQLIDAAYAADPRLKKHKLQRKLAKENEKKSKEDAKNAELKAKEDAAKAAAEAELLAKTNSKEANEAARKARRAFVKKCKKLKVYVEYGAEPAEGLTYVDKEQTDAVKNVLSAEAMSAMVSLKERAEFMEKLMAALTTHADEVAAEIKAGPKE